VEDGVAGKVVEMVQFRPCPEMEEAHAAVDRGDYAAAAGHYVVAAGVAYAAAESGGEEAPKWAAIGDLRVLWSLRAARLGMAE
jgi:hypothetical protein